MLKTRYASLLMLLMFAVLAIVVPVTRAEPPVQMPPGVQLLVPEILSVRPHDPNAFTQGLLLHDGSLYESTGRYGQSTLREVDPETGEVLRQHALVPSIFAEGLALVGDRLIQISWKEGSALVYDLDTFRFEQSFSYRGEGWGLCYDGERLYMSDGTDVITVRDPENFRVLDTINVTYGDQPLPQINELECVDDSIYANVWQTDFIVRIDKESGAIDGLVDLRGLLAPEDRPADPGGVLNGIAYNPETETFLITGKLWSQLFEVRFVPYEP